MKERKMGIVLTKRTQNYIEGYLAYLRVGLKIEEDGKIKLEDEVSKKFFKLQMGRKKILTVGPGASIGDAKQIQQELKEIGFKSVQLSVKNVENVI